MKRDLELEEKLNQCEVVELASDSDSIATLVGWQGVYVVLQLKLICCFVFSCTGPYYTSYKT